MLVKYCKAHLQDGLALLEGCVHFLRCEIKSVTLMISHYQQKNETIMVHVMGKVLICLNVLT